ncbi:fumarylacetoacetate hydrolase family protein [Kineosporia babensis]|uniref:Fumarylacetoacetate hydrolase family protein n=1 Tax=Kineosporia babensis TaxID=499548 RepID=A0A9X1SXG6_9ACTN|nr:fumarylacetoacetate hydrolase family protein [Kineosporia babensis]MCD5315804.1 fumarylacetoacetate hydrolase family protein [Kineosporia babensis]
MKYVTFLSADGPRVGLLTSPSTVTEVLVAGGLPEVITTGGDLPLGAEHAYTDLTILAPIPEPARNIMCVGKNYREHASEFAGSGYDGGADVVVPQFPIIFTKAPSSVTGPDTTVVPPSVVKETDYEAEFAVIIGRGGRDITKDEAMSHVWGYTLINDLTARDLQRDHKQWFLGKSPDGFAPMGPLAVTADEVNLDELVLTGTVNGELRQKASAADLIFDVPTLIATISSVLTLQPGDIIATGTPAGVGIGFTPPRFLTAGDIVEVSAPGLGVLRTTIG